MPMKYVDVVIIVEHKNRELESAVALKVELERLGYSSIILQNSWGERYYATKISPKVVVTPWCYDDEDMKTLCVYHGQQEVGFDIVNLHCEQITSDDASDFLLPSGKAKEIYHCAWGDYFKNQLLECGVNEDHICVTGSPRLDFFRKKYGDLCISKNQLAKDHDLDEKKRWILIAGNYTAAFMSDETLDILEKRGIGGARENSKLSADTYRVVLDWLDNVLASQDADNTEIIYRPHPSEPITKEIKELESKYKCFHVIKEHAIRDWLLSSDFMFMWNSTSSIEAAYADIPILALRPIEIPEHLKFELLDNIEQIRDYEAFECAFEEACLGQSNPNNDEFLEALDFYYRRNRETASAITAQFIVDVIENGKRECISNRPALFGIRKGANYLIKLIAFKLGLLKRSRRYSIVANDRFDESDISAIEDALRRDPD